MDKNFSLRAEWYITVADTLVIQDNQIQELKRQNFLLRNEIESLKKSNQCLERANIKLESDVLSLQCAFPFAEKPQTYEERQLKMIVRGGIGVALVNFVVMIYAIAMFFLG